MNTLHSCSNLFSHPGKALESHLLNVRDWAGHYINSLKPEIKKELEETVLMSATLHDIGKATKYFQDYLFSREKHSRELTQHSLLSAFIYLYLKRDFIGFISILKHHSYLQSFEEMWDNISERKEILEKQIEVLDTSIFEYLGIDFDLLKFRKWFREEADKTLLSFRSFLRRYGSIDLFLKTNLCYSVLVLSDFSDVFYGEKRRNSNISITEEAVENYVNLLPSGKPIDGLRRMAFQEAKKFDVKNSSHIISLTLPTGMGKTLISLYLAFKIKRELGLDGKIIYSLPFLSIIDQNYEVTEKVLTYNGIEPDYSIILKHNYLSEYPQVETESGNSVELGKFILESWNSEIIVTTFIQLFKSIFSNHKQSLKRFAVLKNSVIILDEVQALPTKYWKLIGEVFREFAEKYNIYVIVSTATKPYIFEESIPAVNFNPKLSRVVLRNNLERQTLPQFIEKEIDTIKQKKTLIVLNTINSAKAAYRILKNSGVENITLLTRQIIPKVLRKRVEEIRNGRYTHVVSTQLVEAGVDIDFPYVYRDIAPLDSIIQTAGRCNRNWQSEGVVNVISLVDENRNRLLSSYVYDRILLSTTEKILSEYSEIPEEKFPELIDQYFKILGNKKSQEESEKILSSIEKLDYTEISKFELIEEDYPKVLVFVEYDDEAEGVWKELQEILEIENYKEKAYRLDRIRSKLYNYIVTVPKKANLPPEKDERIDLYYVRREFLEQYYNEETGYIGEEVDVVVI